METKRPVRISQRIAVPLSIVMIIMATLAFTGFSLGDSSDPPIFTSNRYPEDGKHFINHRSHAPQLIYHGLHAAPAIIWSVFMPLQHVESVRKRWPALHRSSGYLIMAGSLVLSMTGYWLILREQTYSHENVWHLHNLSGLSPIGWPTFAASIWILGPFYLYSLFRTARTARSKDFKKHRQWAVFHTIMAYVISLERVSILLTYIIGAVLAIFPKEQVHQMLNIPDTVEGKASAELDMFALANIAGFGLAIWWAISEWRAAGFLKYFRRTSGARVKSS